MVNIQKPADKRTAHVVSPQPFKTEWLISVVFNPELQEREPTNREAASTTKKERRTGSGANLFD